MSMPANVVLLVERIYDQSSAELFEIYDSDVFVARQTISGDTAIDPGTPLELSGGVPQDRSRKAPSWASSRPRMTRLSLIRTARTGSARIDSAACVNNGATVCLKGRDTMPLRCQHDSMKCACKFKENSEFRSSPSGISVAFVGNVAVMQPSDLAWRS